MLSILPAQGPGEVAGAQECCVSSYCARVRQKRRAEHVREESEKAGPGQLGREFAPGVQSLQRTVVRSPGWSHAAQAHADEVAAALPAPPRKQDEDVTAWGLQRPMN